MEDNNGKGTHLWNYREVEKESHMKMAKFRWKKKNERKKRKVEWNVEWENEWNNQWKIAWMKEGNKNK